MATNDKNKKSRQILPFSPISLCFTSLSWFVGANDGGNGNLMSKNQNNDDGTPPHLASV